MAAGERKRRRTRHAAAAGGIAAVALVVLVGVRPLTSLGPAPAIDQPADTTDSPVVQPTDQPEGPSQTEEDAARDGVLTGIAELPFDVRVNVSSSHIRGRSTTRIPAEEGVWIVSRPYSDDSEPSQFVGDPGGVYGRDFVHLSRYSEILLLDPSESRILRAFPLTPSAAAGGLAVDDDAVYCHRGADGGEPDSMLCRIDRSTHEWLVRIFPTGDRSSFAHPGAYIPEHWVMNDPLDSSLQGVLEVSQGELRLVSDERAVTIDPDTLELLAVEQG